MRSLLAAKANANDVARADAISSNSTARPSAEATSALALAVINGHFEIADVLLDGGANPNVADARASCTRLRGCAGLASQRVTGAAAADRSAVLPLHRMSPNAVSGNCSRFSG